MANSPITHIVVHYSATQRGKHHTVADIDAWHRARGFRKIGYHYVIYLDGSVHKGREDSEVGAHVAGHNTGTIGICWIGGVDGNPNKGVDTRTPAQTAALIDLIYKLLEKYPGAKVLGHRDMPDAKTQCPGFDVIPWWAEVNGRPRIAARPVPADAPVRTPNITEDPLPPAISGAEAIGTVIAAGAIGFGAWLWNLLGWVGLVVLICGILALLITFRKPISQALSKLKRKS